jgi:cytochrome c peroxidase
MADFNQSINNSFSSFGRPANDYMSNFGQSNTAFTNIYNQWLNTLNSSYDAMSKNMGTGFNKDELLGLDVFLNRCLIMDHN